MELLIAGLIGVVIGAVAVAAAVLIVQRRAADRDLIERRLRACSEYRDCLGDLSRMLDRQGHDPAVLEQAWKNVHLFCREYRLTSWIFEADLTRKLDRIVTELEEETGHYEQNGNGGAGRTAQLLCEKYHELDHLLRRELERQHREFRGVRHAVAEEPDAP